MALTNHTALVTKNGQTVPIEDSAAPILDESGSLLGAVLVFHDVTSKRRAEQLIESTALFPEEDPFPILRVGEDGALLYANSASAGLLELWKCQVGGAPPAEVRQTAKEALLTRQRQQLDVRCQDRDFSLILVPVQNRNYINLYGRDMTEWNQANADLQAAKEDLARANAKLERTVEDRTARLRETIADLEQFSYSVAHDLRAPLRTMASFSSMLLEDHAPNLDAEGADYLRRIASAAKRMDDLIRDVLTYSRVVRSDSTLAPIDLDHLVHDIINQYPQFSDGAVQISVASPLANVAGSSALLTQCISNLLGNAAKFVTPGVQPRVQVWTEHKDGWVRVCVQDNGIGIDASQLDRIWRIFERAHDPKKYDGTGIGLSVVKRAVERMGGNVGVESTPGQGSTFWFELAPG